MSTSNKLVPVARAALARTEKPLPPSVIEAEVVALREQCGAMLDELSTRVQTALAWPTRMKQQMTLYRRRAERWVRENTVAVVASGIAAAGLLLLSALTDHPKPRRRRRGLFDLLFG